MNSVEIKTFRRFRMAIRLIALDDLFRSGSHQFQIIRGEIEIAAYGGSFNATASDYI